MSSPQQTAPRPARAPAQIEFDDNSLLPLLYGQHDRHLARIEQRLGVSVVSRGNRLSISGPEKAIATAQVVLRRLYERLKAGRGVLEADVDAAIRMADEPDPDAAQSLLHVRGRRIAPRSPAQARYIDAMQTHDLVFGIGPAGTGKTYLAVCAAVSMMSAGAVDRIVLSRPAVEAGERLGFLPGDMREKVDPYLRPLYDALHDTMSADQVLRRLASGEIEIAPLAFMRGRTLKNAFVILDEAQNTTPMQMKMFLTRLGENSRMVVTGDLSQVDLPAGAPSGMANAIETLRSVKGIAFVRFTAGDVVRPPLVSRIVRAYDARAAISDG